MRKIVKRRGTRQWTKRTKNGRVPVKGTFIADKGITWQNKLDTGIFDSLKKFTVKSNKADKEKEKAQIELAKQIKAKQDLELEEERIKQEDLARRFEQKKKTSEFMEGREAARRKERTENIRDAAALTQTTKQVFDFLIPKVDQKAINELMATPEPEKPDKPKPNKPPIEPSADPELGKMYDNFGIKEVGSNIPRKSALYSP